MTTKTIEAKITPTNPLFFVPQTKIGRITAIEIDNPTASAITIKINDIFTPIPSVNIPNPTEITETKKVITVQANNHFSETQLNIKILGSVFIIANADDENVITTITYDLE